VKWMRKSSVLEFHSRGQPSNLSP